MKNIFLIASFFICILSSKAGENPISKENERTTTRIISGKVIDKVTGEELSGAEIRIGDKKYLTDLNGNFSIIIPAVNTTATINFVSYNDIVVEINPFSYETLTIELISK